jgi:hypothetical protein
MQKTKEFKAEITEVKLKAWIVREKKCHFCSSAELGIAFIKRIVIFRKKACM